MSTFDNQSISIGCVGNLGHLFGLLRHYLLKLLITPLLFGCWLTDYSFGNKIFLHGFNMGEEFSIHFLLVKYQETVIKGNIFMDMVFTHNKALNTCDLQTLKRLFFSILKRRYTSHTCVSVAYTSMTHVSSFENGRNEKTISYQNLTLRDIAPESLVRHKTSTSKHFFCMVLDRSHTVNFVINTGTMFWFHTIPGFPVVCFPTCLRGRP